MTGVAAVNTARSSWGETAPPGVGVSEGVVVVVVVVHACAMVATMFLQIATHLGTSSGSKAKVSDAPEEDNGSTPALTQAS